MSYMSPYMIAQFSLTDLHTLPLCGSFGGT